jgi:hypothetical protein
MFRRLHLHRWLSETLNALTESAAAFARVGGPEAPEGADIAQESERLALEFARLLAGATPPRTLRRATALAPSPRAASGCCATRRRAPRCGRRCGAGRRWSGSRRR